MNDPTRQSRQFLRLGFAGLCMVILASGCNQPTAPDYASLGLAEVSGTIRLDESPLANAHVIFEAPDESYSFGKTDSGGKYKLMFNSQQSGVLTGPKIVRIQLSSISEDSADEPSGGEGAGSEDLESAMATDSSELPRSYHRDSRLKATVAAGVQTINFDLKTDGSTTTATQ
jgi:hypothetical protein